MNQILRFWMFFVFLKIALTSDDHENCGLFSGNHSIPVTKTDENGHKCHGVVPVAICGGLCETSEKGTHFFPHRENENTACAPLETTPVTHELTNCDDEAIPTIRSITFNEPKQCGCKAINDNTVN